MIYSIPDHEKRKQRIRKFSPVDELRRFWNKTGQSLELRFFFCEDEEEEEGRGFDREMLYLKQPNCTEFVWGLGGNSLGE